MKELLSDKTCMITSSKGNIFGVTGPLCGEFTGPGEFPTQRPVTWSFDVFFDLCLNKRLSKQPWGWWFETPSWSLWRQCNVNWRKCARCHGCRQDAVWYFCAKLPLDVLQHFRFCCACLLMIVSILIPTLSTIAKSSPHHHHHPICLLWTCRFLPEASLAFGYCHRLRLCVCVFVCVCVSLCVNHLLVRAMTRDPFKLGMPNLDQWCKRPWLKSLSFWGVIDLDLQGQI